MCLRSRASLTFPSSNDQGGCHLWFPSPAWLPFRNYGGTDRAGQSFPFTPCQLPANSSRISFAVARLFLGRGGRFRGGLWRRVFFADACGAYTGAFRALASSGREEPAGAMALGFGGATGSSGARRCFRLRPVTALWGLPECFLCLHGRQTSSPFTARWYPGWTLASERCWYTSRLFLLACPLINWICESGIPCAVSQVSIWCLSKWG